MTDQLSRPEFEELIALDSIQRPHTDAESDRAIALFDRLSEGQLTGYYKLLEFVCCDTTIQHPTFDQPTTCPECGSEFSLVRW